MKESFNRRIKFVRSKFILSKLFDSNSILILKYLFFLFFFAPVNKKFPNECRSLLIIDTMKNVVKISRLRRRSLNNFFPSFFRPF